MKISNETLAVLKNFSGINTGIAVKSGNRLRTISGQKNILAETTVGENFDTDFAIYDLNQFLGAVSLFSDGDADFEFGSNSVVVGKGRSKIKYFYADPSMVVSPPDKELPTDADVEFELPAANLQEVLRGASVLGAPDIVIKSDGAGNTLITACDVKNDTSNTYDVEVEHTSDTPFRMVFRTENLKMLPGTYNVKLTPRYGLFTSTKSDLRYFVSVEAGSTYGS